MTTPQRIESALKNVHDQRSFLKELLVGALEWPVGDRIEDLGEISYNWSAAELRLQGLEKQLIAGQVLQIQPLRQDQPWGIFILEFSRPDAFTAERGMTGFLRRVLRGLVLSRRKGPSQKSWQRENLLFICTHDYTQFRFAHFKAPSEEGGVPRLAAFGWQSGSPEVRTVCEFNLTCLAWPDEPSKTAAWVDLWTDAFDVERVTKRFFEQYRDADKHIRGYVARAMGQKDIDAESVKLFTQTLLNRLMFLRFIERKGWLHPPGNEHSRDYLRELYARGGYRGKSFYAGRLKKQESEAIGHAPFLNGGLFEEQKGLDDQVEDLEDKAFAPLLGDVDGEPGLFYRYNFTVQESTPFDVEVAVDPEMLGKVFEELVTGRHESGSYYTPRPVVSFMCREALKGHLADATQIDEVKVAAFVDRHETPFDIEEARKLVAALDELKAVDPACGSGAYLLGLLHEMVDLYQLLYSDKLKKDARSIHKLKLDIIERNLYGADKDLFATNIAMLRLWLSLSVDSDEPQSLPNLDFKIEAGDSLIGPDPQVFSHLFLQEPAIQLAVMKGKYLRAHGEEKKALRQLILKEQKELGFKLRSLCPGAIDWRVQFCEVFFRPQGGFDIVLANPPYVRMELFKAIKPSLKQNFPEAHAERADLYCYFYARALQLLASGGMLVFVSSNKWLRAAYGARLRMSLAARCSVLGIIDFGELPVFELAATFPMICVAQKGRPQGELVLTRVKSLDPPYPDVAAIIRAVGQRLDASVIAGSNWNLTDSTLAKVLSRMDASGVSLQEYAADQIFWGVKTGLNAAFIIDNETRTQLIEAGPACRAVIKPLAVGDDVRRWRICSKDRWLLYLYHDIDIRQLKPIIEYLRPFRAKLEARATKQNWYELQQPQLKFSEFMTRPKIVFPDIAKEPRFTLDRSGAFLLNTTYFIPSDDLFLLGVLNSRPMWCYCSERLSVLGDADEGGRLRFFRHFVEKLPIPKGDTAERSAVAALAEKCLNAQGVGCEAWQSEIDERVAGLYGL
jgi:hypothetical protein